MFIKAILKIILRQNILFTHPLVGTQQNELFYFVSIYFHLMKLGNQNLFTEFKNLFPFLKYNVFKSGLMHSYLRNHQEKMAKL